MKKFLFLFTLIFQLSLLSAQEMSVKSFYLAETDLTANTPGTMVYDQNGNVCALISGIGIYAIRLKYISG